MHIEFLLCKQHGLMVWCLCLFHFNTLTFVCLFALMLYSEQSVVAVKAAVMIYDEGNRRWMPSGSSQGISKIHIYQHVVNNTFRVVGRKLQDHEVRCLCMCSSSFYVCVRINIITG